MKFVNGYYIKKVYCGRRGWNVVVTKGYKKNEDNYKCEDVNWFRTQKEAIEWCNNSKPGKSN